MTNQIHLIRALPLLTPEGLERLASARVAVIGLGGVGGYCAETLARSGVGRLLLIDCDVVDESNLNRQLFATRNNIGQSKTAAAAERLRLVSYGEFDCINARITAENAAELLPTELDFVVDAIDDLPAKLELARLCSLRGTPFIACMGAGRRLDPTAFVVTDAFSTTNCPLARRYRQGLRRLGLSSVTVVASTEIPQAVENGVTTSLAPVVAAAGAALGGWVLCKLTEAERIASGKNTVS